MSSNERQEQIKQLDDYFIDKYEVTNREYREFITAGGYFTREYWPARFMKDGSEIGWEEAMQQFRDRTGLPGPRSWSGQNYQADKADHPVTDITWYEAAAYARFRGKELPTIFQWEKAARNGLFTYYSALIMPWGPVDVGGTVEHRANFKSTGTVPVSSNEFGMSPFGCYQMAGNVAEWCRNELNGGFVTAGGSWEDAAYVFSHVGAFPGFYSAPGTGFRCVLNPPGNKGNQGEQRIDTTAQVPVYSPVSEAEFQGLLSHFQYDKSPLKAQIIETRETPEWRREKIIYTGAREEQVIAYLYLPAQFTPPYQVMQFVPAGDVYGRFVTLSESIEMFLLPHVRAGRAVFAVVFKGFRERDHAPNYTIPRYDSVRRREEIVSNAVDLRRGLDYLAERTDIDLSRLVFYGFSQGAQEGLIYAAVEPRYRAVVLVAGGVRPASQKWIAEASPPKFAGHIGVPKLMISGRYDEAFPLKTDLDPLYQLLREPKRQVIFAAGHSPPLEIELPTVKTWLDEILGPVRRRQAQN